MENVDDDDEKEEKDFLEVDLLRKEAAAAAKAALLSFAEEDEEGRDTFLDSILGKSICNLPATTSRLLCFTSRRKTKSKFN